MDKRFQEFIVEKGLKSTRERREIVDAIMETTGHFDPEELYRRLRDAGSKVSRASVYRTIPLLIESGFIEEVERVDKHAHYERVIGTQHHDHMICTQCGKVIEFYSPTLEMLQDELCCKENFRKVRHHLEILGICAECRGEHA
ncbi:MAG: transcriptional repressor [Nitrospiraceae bacterium]|nr:transcriptional repressor [Nitrospiraceae bacterium]